MPTDHAVPIRQEDGQTWVRSGSRCLSRDVPARPCARPILADGGRFADRPQCRRMVRAESVPRARPGRRNRLPQLPCRENCSLVSSGAGGQAPNTPSLPPSREYGMCSVLTYRHRRHLQRGHNRGAPGHPPFAQSRRRSSGSRSFLQTVFLSSV